MKIRVGLPIPGGTLAEAAREIGAPVLVSANAFGVREDADATKNPTLRDPTVLYFRKPAASLEGLDVALDSAGFVAMARYGYFPFTPEQYINQLAATFPWAWYSAMDCCCEPEVAADRATVRMRIAETARLYGECSRLAERAGIRQPMPTLQGWKPEDYERCFDTMPILEWPDLVGIGSVCRRQLHGDDGLFKVLERVDRFLPPHVKLHLFGVKGDALPYIRGDRAFAERVESIDSMAWDQAARRAQQTDRTMDVRVPFMKAWYEKQVEHTTRPLTSAAREQLGLFEDIALEFSHKDDDARDALIAEYESLVASGEWDYQSAMIHLAQDLAYLPDRNPKPARRKLQRA